MAKQYKLRRSPYLLSIAQIHMMEISMGQDFPAPKDVPGAELKLKKNMFSSDVWLIHAEPYFKLLIEKGYGKILEENGVICVDSLVGNFGAWK